MNEISKWKLVFRAQPAGAVGHGMRALRTALERKNIPYYITNHHLGPFTEGLVWLGYQTEPFFSRYGQKTPLPPEGFYFSTAGTPDAHARLLGAADERGLAYGLLELAERVSAEGEDALTRWPAKTNAPEQAVRGVNRFITNSFDEAWWMNRDYWDFYFQMLLSARFNHFTLMFGFDTAYFSPPYPFFVEVKGYENVRVAEWFAFDRAAYLAALNQIGEMCHDYGMTFTMAIWQQVPWQSGQQNMVEGAAPDILESYCAAGLKALLAACPSIDRVHFRVNHESGVGTQNSAEEYWLRQIDAIADFNRENHRDVHVELRAKGMTDRMADHAKERGLSLTVSTKYWCEQAGLPFHLTRMRSQEMPGLENLNASRRYSYADMLCKPLTHQFVYRLWANGSTNLFTWGDPDYVRRFMDSLRVGDADGFEVMPPLSYKGGQELIKAPRPWNLFDDPSFQPEGFEESRYWLFYRLFGRLGYNKNDARAAWERPMEERFGPAARPLMDMIAHMSRLVPYLVASHFPSHPQQEYWAEFNTGGALFNENTFNRIQRKIGVTYQNTLPSDEGLFYSIDQFTQAQLSGTLDGRITPAQSARYIGYITDQTQKALDKAVQAGLPETPEARGVILDAKMLIALGKFHICKISAACAYSRYAQTGDNSLLCGLPQELRRAREYWAELSEHGKKYHHPLEFSTGVGHLHTGTWSDALAEIDADIQKIDELTRDLPSPAITLEQNPAETKPPAALLWETDLPSTHNAGADLSVTLDTRGDGRAASAIRMRYRAANQLEGLFRSAVMEPVDGEAGQYRAVIPGGDIPRSFDLLVYFEATDRLGDGLLYPGLLHPRIELPYFLVQTV